MVTRLRITLEQNEFAGLLRLAEQELRNPAEQVRFLLREYLEEKNFISDETEADTVSSDFLDDSLVRKGS